MKHHHENHLIERSTMTDRLPDLNIERQDDGTIHAICQGCHRYQEFTNFTDALMWPHECPNE